MKAQTFALITAGIVGGTGIAGMIQSWVEDKGQKNAAHTRRPENQGRIGGLVPTNTTFNLLRVGIGVAGVVCAQNEESAAIFNRSVAISYAGMAVMGLFPATDKMFGLMPLYGANVFLHGGIAAAELLTEGALLKSATGALPFVDNGTSASASI